jgi:Flp pilus assembly protein TadG
LLAAKIVRWQCRAVKPAEDLATIAQVIRVGHFTALVFQPANRTARNMSAPRFSERAIALILRFRRDNRANVAITFVIALLPLLAAVGCALDYSLATRMKAKLQSAADSASVGSVSRKSAGYLAAIAMTSDGPVPPGVTDATNIFNGNIGGTTGYTNLALTSTVTKTGSTITSDVQFSAQVPVVFMKVLGYQALTVTGKSNSSASLPLYLDFYLMLDVSGSMGLPSTNAEQTRLSVVNPDNFSNYPGGCTLACHFATQDVCTNGTQKYPTNNYCMGYPISRVSYSGYQQVIQQNSGHLPSSWLSTLPTSLYNNLAPVTSCPTDGTDACIQLRADAVGYAVNQLFITANATEQIANQFRIGLYPFIQSLYAYYALTSSINGSSTNSSTINYAAANLASQLDTNTNSGLGSGGTHFENAFTTMNGLISSVGNGSAWNNTLPYVFLVTDGAEDPQTKGLNGGGWSGSNHATVLDPVTQCKPLKDRGIIVSVLYIPYQPIQNPNASFANDEDDYANNNIANIPTSLQACASPGFFYTANTPADITTALNAMFNHALVVAHITN